MPFHRELSYQFKSKRFGTSDPSSEGKIEIWTPDTTGITIKTNETECYRTGILTGNIAFFLLSDRKCSIFSAGIGQRHKGKSRNGLGSNVYH